MKIHTKYHDNRSKRLAETVRERERQSERDGRRLHHREEASSVTYTHRRNAELLT